MTIAVAPDFFARAEAARTPDMTFSIGAEVHAIALTRALTPAVERIWHGLWLESAPEQRHAIYRTSGLAFTPEQDREAVRRLRIWYFLLGPGVEQTETLGDAT